MTCTFCASPSETSCPQPMCNAHATSFFSQLLVVNGIMREMRKEEEEREKDPVLAKFILHGEVEVA